MKCYSSETSLWYTDVYIASLQISKPTWSSAPPSIATTPGKRITSTSPSKEHQQLRGPSLIIPYPYGTTEMMTPKTAQMLLVSNVPPDVNSGPVHKLTAVSILNLLFYTLTIYLFFPLQCSFISINNNLIFFVNWY